MKNKKGFTLVELLAVIVVLAIIMIIAVPAVLNSMTDARKGAFAVYGQKLIGAAQTQYQADQLKGQTTGCYNISQLIEGATGSYKGFVTVGTDASGKTTYTVTFHDNNYMVYGLNSSELDNLGDKVNDLAKDTTFDNDSAKTLYNYVDDTHKTLNNSWACQTPSA